MNGTVEPGSVGSVFWFETTQFPRVFLWSPHHRRPSSSRIVDPREVNCYSTCAGVRPLEVSGQRQPVQRPTVGETPITGEAKLLDLFVIRNLHDEFMRGLSLGLAGKSMAASSHNERPLESRTQAQVMEHQVKQ